MHGNYSSSVYNLSDTDDAPKNRWAWIDYPMLAPLAAGIVKQAAEDWYCLKCHFPLLPSGAESCTNVKEIENFFHSQWYEQLTNIDADYMLRMLEERVKNTHLKFDIGRERGSSRYYVFRYGDESRTPVSNFYDTKKKALNRAAKLNDLPINDYMRLRKRDLNE